MARFEIGNITFTEIDLPVLKMAVKSLEQQIKDNEIALDNMAQYELDLERGK